MRQCAGNPVLLRTLILGSLGFSLTACGGSVVEHTPTSQDGGAGGSDSVGGRGGVVGVGGVSGGTGGRLPGDCTSPVPLVPGVDTGFFQCAEGYIHRAAIHECGSVWPRDGVIAEPAVGGAPSGVGGAGGSSPTTPPPPKCQRDADCPTDAFCNPVTTNVSQQCGYLPQTEIRCVQGCRTDADCGERGICVCGTEIGTCTTRWYERGGCSSDADCDGSECLSNGPGFGCQFPDDQCKTDADCRSPSTRCQIYSADSTSPPARKCLGAPVCGRPFLVAGEARLATAFRANPRRDPETALLDTDTGRRLAEHWTRIGLMEHASIAAFARFTLQLLSLGAPMELVSASNEAQADETRHTAMAFEFAAAYAGTRVIAGPIDLRGAFATQSVEEILRTTIQEGCCGETFASMEVGEAARVATVPKIRAALASVAADESRHAVLAWRTVKWILSEHPELVSVARDEFERLSRDEDRETPSARFARIDDERAREHGLLATATLARVRASALRDVILPCARALLAS
jgi:hypothetical protein